MNIDRLMESVSDASHPMLASMAEGRGMPFWDAVNNLGELSSVGEQHAIERPASIIALVQRLTRAWPDCPLCRRDVNNCRCDPDAYASAVARTVENGNG